MKSLTKLFTDLTYPLHGNASGILGNVLHGQSVHPLKTLARQVDQPDANLLFVTQWVATPFEVLEPVSKIINIPRYILPCNYELFSRTGFSKQDTSFSKLYNFPKNYKIREIIKYPVIGYLRMLRNLHIIDTFHIAPTILIFFRLVTWLGL